MLGLLEAGFCDQVWPVTGLKGPTWKESKLSCGHISKGYTFLDDLDNFLNGHNVTINTFVLQLHL